LQFLHRLSAVACRLFSCSSEQGVSAFINRRRQRRLPAVSGSSDQSWRA